MLALLSLLFSGSITIKFLPCMMPGLVVIFVLHFCVTVLSYSPGVSFLMERHPDNYFCGHLQCVADLTHSEHDVSSLVEMTIYDITRVNSDLKLASVSRFHPDLYVDTTKSSAMSCTGIISRHQANLTVQLRHDIDCLYGVYKCQLDVVTASGHSEVLTEILTPELNHNYSRMEEMISHFSRLKELLSCHTVHVNNQTAGINRLVNQLDDQSAETIKQTVLIKRLASQSDNQTAEINRYCSQSVNQTAEIQRLASQLDNQTAAIIRLTSQSDNEKTQINRLVNQLDDQTAQVINQTMLIKRLASQLDNQTTEKNRFTSQLDQLSQLINQLNHKTSHLIGKETQLQNISLRLDLEMSEQKPPHGVTQERLKNLEVKLNTVEKLSNETADIFHDQETCTKGEPANNGTTKIVWVGNIPVLCDTKTDGGGWIIIQRREKGDVDFHRNWTDYKNGFGTLDTEFWIGNDVVHNLTSQGFNELRVDLHGLEPYYAHYSYFSIANESMNYRLSVGGYSGTAGDGLGRHNDTEFSTYERDSPYSSQKCPAYLRGAWWYNDCHYSTLSILWRGIFLKRGNVKARSYARFTEMKLRRG